MGTPKYNISKTLINEALVYYYGNGCGKKFKECTIERNYPFKMSEPAKLGHYFEYKATGAIPRGHNEAPQPNTTKKGELTAEYKRAYEQAEKFKQFCEDLGIEIVEVSKYHKTENRLSGEFDIVAIPKGDNSVLERKTIIDLKYTGMINNVWDGWGIERLDEKHDKVVQADHYVVLGAELYEEEVDFMFWLFSSGTDMESKLIKVEFTEGTLMQHIENCETIDLMIQKDLMLDSFYARPSMNKCKDCPVENCESRQKAPELNVIESYPKMINRKV